MTTTIFQGSRTITFNGSESEVFENELTERYETLLNEKKLNWTEYLRLERRLGAGGQGIVFLSQRRGADDFTLPVALKIFSPENFRDMRAYDEAMSRIARVSSRVAQIQQDNLLKVHNFADRHRIRLMEMEWIDGYDLTRLLSHRMLKQVFDNVSVRRWDYINNVIVTRGPVHPRIKPGVAVAITREVLAALAALHRGGIVHGDIKPSNIMLKRTGSAKLVDIGSAFEIEDPPPHQTCTPSYAAPEVLDRSECTPLSDLASLGYVLIEMISGRPLFAKINKFDQLLEAKRLLPQQLPDLLPKEVVVNRLLMNFLQGMIAPDPVMRFPSAEAADLVKEGAAAFHRQLVMSDLSAEYENEIRLWLEALEL